MKVAIAVHGRFHAFELARELVRRKIAVTLATTYPGLIARPMLPPDVDLRSAPLLEIARRLAASVPAFPSIDVWLASRFGRFAARTLPATADIFVGWSGASIETIEVARSRGMRVVIERGSSHIAHQAKVLADEYHRRGVRAVAVDPRMIDRELKEYEAADAIMVPTRYAASTFVQHGTSPSKLVINPYGVNMAKYVAMPVSRPPSPRTRILFVGRIGLRKGIPYLLQAFQKLGTSFELHLVGPQDAEMDSVARSYPEHIQLHGTLRGASLEARFQDADIFCLPSLEEGLSLALLQAMAAGLPVVATPETGAEDVVTEGQEGFLVPARDAERLASALLGLSSRERRVAMGTAARARVASAFSWSDYGDRAIAAYHRLLH